MPLFSGFFQLSSVSLHIFKLNTSVWATFWNNTSNRVLQELRFDKLTNVQRSNGRKNAVSVPRSQALSVEIWSDAAIFYVIHCVSIVKKLMKKLNCEECKKCLVGSIFQSDHDYCGASTYDEVSSASAFTLFVNNGALKIPSKSVFRTIERCEHIFKQSVVEKGISTVKKLKHKMILNVCQHLLFEASKSVFEDHNGENDHQLKLIKWTADKYFTLRLFTYGKHFYLVRQLDKTECQVLGIS